MDLGLDALNRVDILNFKDHSLAREILDIDFYFIMESVQINQENGRTTSDVIILNNFLFIEMLSSESYHVLIRWDSLHVLDLGLDFFNRFLIVNCKVYYLACESFHIDVVFCLGSTTR